MYAGVVLGVGKGALFREVSSSVLIEGFHCNYTPISIETRTHYIQHTHIQ